MWLGYAMGSEHVDPFSLIDIAFPRKPFPCSIIPILLSLFYYPCFAVSLFSCSILIDLLIDL
jgi:hypothetical protein